MGKFAIGKYAKTAAWLIAGVIVILNANMVINEISAWLATSEYKTILYFTVVPVTIALALLLIFITVRPLIKKFLIKTIRSPHEAPKLGNITAKTHYGRIAVAVDFSEIDTEVIRHAISLSKPETKILVIHIVETAGAILMGNDISDFETHLDENLLKQYQKHILDIGFETDIQLGFGNPLKIIPEKVNEFGADILVMGAHGHKGLSDIVFGTTVDKVRHRVNIPVFIVKGLANSR
jgi:manganese transport protein